VHRVGLTYTVQCSIFNDDNLTYRSNYMLKINKTMIIQYKYREIFIQIYKIIRHLNFEVTKYIVFKNKTNDQT
jgi:hypothetical protein